MPSTPSTTTSADRSAESSRSLSAPIRPPAASSAARPAACGSPSARTARTRQPRRASRAPANSASPPLLPGPTKISTRARRRDRGSREEPGHGPAKPCAARCISASSPTTAMQSASSRRVSATEYAYRISPRRPPWPRRCRRRGRATRGCARPAAPPPARRPYRSPRTTACRRRRSTISASCHDIPLGAPSAFASASLAAKRAAWDATERSASAAVNSRCTSPGWRSSDSAKRRTSHTSMPTPTIKASPC